MIGVSLLKQLVVFHWLFFVWLWYSHHMKFSLLRPVLLLPLLLTAQSTLAQGLQPVRPFLGTSQSNLIDAVQFIINILLVLVGLAAAVMLIVGGVQYITSRGDDTKAEEAKNTILYAVMGLIVIGLSAAIVNYVIVTVNRS